MVQFDNEIARIAQEIEHYLLAHPRAADSVEGITKWWLSYQRSGESMDHVQQALDVLIAQGRIVKINNVNGTCIYKKNTETGTD